MLDIGIGELQKNSSIFSNLTEALQIVDKRKKQVLAMVYPVQKNSVVEKLAGKYKTKIDATTKDLQTVKEEAMKVAMEEKYGFST